MSDTRRSLNSLDDIKFAVRRIEELEAELRLMKTSGIVEVAVRNPNVMEHMKHWEGRAEAAEAKLAKMLEIVRSHDTGDTGVSAEDDGDH